MDFKAEEFKKYKSGLILTLCTWGLYFLYICPKMLFLTDKGIETGLAYVWADWPVHIAQAIRFAYHEPSSWFTATPFYYDHRMTQHFVVNLISAILMRMGVSLINAFVIPSIILTIVLLVVLYTFFFQFFKSKFQAFFSVTLFLANGGLGIIVFINDVLKNGFIKTLSFPPQSYTNLQLPDSHTPCQNFIISELLPQRAFLLGLPIALILIMVLQHWIKNNFNNTSNLHLILFGLMTGCMFAIHAFSFITLVILGFVLILYTKKYYEKWILIVLGVCLSFGFIYFYVFGGQIESKSFIRWHLGWMSHSKNILDFISFWIINWGAMLPLAVYSTIEYKRYKEPIILWGWAIFLISNLFLVAPWDWDNYKLLTWSYLVFCIPVISLLSYWWNKKDILIRISVVVLFLSMTGAGFVDIYKITKTEKLKYTIWNNDEIKLADEFRKISLSNDRVLTADIHNHWVSCLSGRQIVMGFTGQIWSWGIDVGNTPQDVKNMYSGTESSKQLMKQYKISYIVIGPQEQSKFHPDENFFLENYKLVLQRGAYKVFKVT